MGWQQNRRKQFMLLGMSLVMVIVAPSFGLKWIWPWESDEALIYWQMRVPRVLSAWLLGAGLALSGMVFQALLCNVLAEPFILGVASGAALGAASYIYLGLSFSLWIFSGISLLAFLGASLISTLIYIVAFWRREIGRDPTFKLLLMGVILSFFTSSLIMLLQAVGNPARALEFMRWMMGSLSGLHYGDVIQLSIMVALGGLGALYSSPKLNILQHGNIVALTRGVHPQRVMAQLFLLITAMVALFVAIAGPIGFVGLVVPHLARRYFGNDHRQLTPVAMLLGGAVLVIADLLGVLLFAPAEIPVGVITAILGAPFFLYLLFKQDRKGR